MAENGKLPTESSGGTGSDKLFRQILYWVRRGRSYGHLNQEVTQSDFDRLAQNGQELLAQVWGSNDLRLREFALSIVPCKYWQPDSVPRDQVHMFGEHISFVNRGPLRKALRILIAGAKDAKPGRRGLVADQKAPRVPTGAEEAPATVEAAPDAAVKDRKKQVDEFLQQANRLSGTAKITRTHIWKSLDYRSPRQFQYWQSNSAKATKSNEKKFGGLLEEGAEKFVKTLRR